MHAFSGASILSLRPSNLGTFLPPTNTSRPPARQFSMRAMRFRPCIDLHNGRVKQIVGGTLADGSEPTTNFESELPSSHFSSLYRRDRLPGGHVIMLGPGNEDAALNALSAFPGGMHVGGGIVPENANRYLDAGASHVIVTSYVFNGGRIAWNRVQNMVRAVGRDRLVLDLSCRKRDSEYFVCTNRWQKWTNFVLNEDNFARLGELCDEILVHAVDVEGKKCGIDLELVECLADWATVPVTYAGGVRDIADLEKARLVSKGKIDVTIGSALSIFGGSLQYKEAVKWQREQENLVLSDI